MFKRVQYNNLGLILFFFFIFLYFIFKENVGQYDESVTGFLNHVFDIFLYIVICDIYYDLYCAYKMSRYIYIIQE